jgi:hypothetical protein
MIAVIYVIYIQVLDTGIAWKKSLAFRLFKNPKRFAVMSGATRRKLSIAKIEIGKFCADCVP